MIATDGNHVRTVGGGLLTFLIYGLFFWRVFKRNPRNRLIECGSITLIIFLAMLPIISSDDAPDWLFGSCLILLVLLCFATLFFLFQRMFRALARRSNEAKGDHL